MKTDAWRRCLLGLILALGCVAGAKAAYPEKSIRMIVAFPAGGGTDIVARLVAERLSNILGQPIVVDNRGGAAGVLGTEAAARSAPDGYTIFMATLGNISINPHLYKMSVDPLKDLMPITKVVDVNFVLVTNPSFPPRSVKELIDLARQRPEQINYSSSGVGGAPHLAGELFNAMAGVKLTHIPYKGSAPSFTDLVGGQVSLTYDSLVQSMPYIQAGRLRPLAVLSSRRLDELPDVPTVSETVPGYEFTNWFGLFAPAGVPADRIATINEAVRKVLAEPQVREQLLKVGAVPAYSTPEAYAELTRNDNAKWGKIIRERNIQGE